MKWLGRIVDAISKYLGYFAGGLLVAMMLLIVVEVVMRYAVGRPLLLADEFGAYLFVAVAFLGLAYAWLDRTHVRITMLASRLPVRASSWMRLVTLIIAFALSIGLTQAGYLYVQRSFQFKMASDSWLRVPLQGPQMPIAIGFAVLALLLLVEVARAVRRMQIGESADEKGADEVEM